MSLADIRPYFKSRMETLGLKEWKNPFDTQNIPENIIASQYNVALGTLGQIKFTQQSLQANMPVNLKCFAKAYRQHMVAYDSAVALADDVIVEVLNPVNRLNATGFQNIQLGQMTIDPLSLDNDNIMVVSFVFNVGVSLEVCS